MGIIGVLAFVGICWLIYKALRLEIRWGRELHGKRPQDVKWREDRDRRWGNLGKKLFGP